MATFNAEQMRNAGIIVGVGNSAGANAKQLLASIETALVESNLKNLNYGDRDSKGLFQQRPSQGWGSVAQILIPEFAARSFFLGVGTNKGVMEVSQSGTAGNMAQRVQRSAFPSRYDQREGDALRILAALGEAGPVDSGGGVIDAGSGSGELEPIDGASGSSGMSLLAGGSILGTLAIVGGLWWLVDWLTDD